MKYCYCYNTVNSVCQTMDLRVFDTVECYNELKMSKSKEGISSKQLRYYDI